MYMCAYVAGRVSVCLSTCASKGVFTLYSCLCVSVFCSKQMFFVFLLFFIVCVRAESDQHQPVQ